MSGSNDPGVGVSGVGPEYTVVFKEFTDASTGDFSPGAVRMFVDNPTNLAWTEYVNEVGEAFFTIAQKDAKAFILQDVNYPAKRPIMEIYRNAELVWAGWLGEVDETDTDLICYGYSYLSGFYDLVHSYTKKYTAQTVAQIVQDSLNVAQGKTDSRVAWITDGTIQNPVTTSGGGTGITMPLYRAPYKRILQVFKEMAAYAISDTTNHVIFEVTPAGTFNFWKDRKSTIDNVIGAYKYGNVRSFRRIRRPVMRRNQILAVGTSPTSVNLNVTKTSTGLRDVMGLSEEPIYFSFVRDADELSRVSSLRLSRATRVDADLYVSFHKNSLVPYRATGATYALGDIVNFYIEHGASLITNGMVVMGQQVVYSRKSENVRLLLGDKL